MSQRKHPKYEYLTSRWGGMKLREEFEERIENWLRAFDDSEQEMLLSLLSQFYYYSEEKIKQKSKELYQKFLIETSDDENTVIFTKIIKDLGASYSDILFNTFWLSNDLYDSCEPQILDLIENLDESEMPESIGIIDDYSGSGKTFVKTINKMLEINKYVAQVHIFFLTLHITNTAITLINEFSQKTGLKIDIIYLDVSDKAFKDDYLYNRVDARMQRIQYERLCIDNKIKSNYIFGFEEIESLVAFHYNTPNNTLGLFWQDCADFMALFPRHRKKYTHLSQMQKSAQKRKNAKKAKAIYGFNDAKYALFMAYCVSVNKNFSFEQAKIDFGLNQDQLSELIDRMIREGYIITQNDKFIATPKLKSNMFTSRLKSLKKAYTTESVQNEKTRLFNEVSYVPKKF